MLGDSSDRSVEIAISVAAGETVFVRSVEYDRQSSETLCDGFPDAATAGSPDPLVENGPRLRWSTPIPEYLWFLVPVEDDQIGLAIVPDSDTSSAIALLDGAKTRDLGGELGTDAFTDAIIQRLK